MVPKFHIAFSQIPKIGSQKFNLLKNYFPDIEAAWRASSRELMAAGLEQNLAEEVVSRRQNINPDEEVEKLQKENISAVTSDDADYPKLLKETYSPPFILYYKGNIKNLHEEAIAVVGTRRMTNYGKLVTPQIVSQLVNEGILIVSGLALGIDALAHLTCVRNQKPTVAVLGSGLDKQNIYPSINRSLANEILENNGLVISEFPVGMMPLKHNFPARNRIISGLARGTLVIEAGESSGALITAKFALDQNREVFAIPGQIGHPLSVGTNSLIKRGAKLVMSADDIFEELNLKQLKLFKNNQQLIPDTAEEGAILKHLQTEPLHINEIVRLSDLTTPEVNAALMMLEMKGLVRNLGNNNFIAKRNS